MAKKVLEYARECCKCEKNLDKGEEYEDYFVVEVADWDSWVICKECFEKLERWLVN